MDTIILELYNKIKQAQIKNSLSSDYWIFQVESVIVKEDGVSKRYLKVLFFNRKMNEKGQLMRLYLNVGGEHIEKDDFVVSSLYKNQSIMGFLLERDLIDDSKDIRIEGYVVNGKKVQCDLTKMTDLFFEFDTKKQEAMIDTGICKDDMIVTPYFDDEKWFCTCGYCNAHDDAICPICARKRDDMQKLSSGSVQEMILSTINEQIPISLEKPIKQVVDTYINILYDKYAISKETLYEHINLELLTKKQNEKIENYLRNYIAKNAINLNKGSLEEAIACYAAPLLNDVITIERFEQTLDMNKLQQEFDQNQQSIKEKSKKANYSIVLVGVVIACCVIFGIFKLSNNETVEPVVLLNTLENRKANCEDSLDMVDFASVNDENMESYIRQNYYCPFTPEYTQYPQVNIIEKDNKVLRVLDEQYAWVKETIGEEGFVIETFYLGDLEGNHLDDNKAKYRNEITYIDGRILHINSYKGEELYRQDFYEYETDTDYTVEVRIEGEWYGDFQYVNNRILKGDTVNHVYSEKMKHYEWDYEDDSTYRIYEYDKETNELVCTTSYQNNRPIQKMYSSGDGLIRYYYDINGLLAKRASSDRNSQGTTFLYSYNFEKNTMTSIFYVQEGEGNYRLLNYYDGSTYIITNEKAFEIEYYDYDSYMFYEGIEWL